MADQNQPNPSSTPQRADGSLFTEPASEKRTFPTSAVAIAAVVILALVAGLALLNHRKGAGTGGSDTLQPLAAYAPQLKLSGIEMSESTSFSGGKSTFIDGHISNTGSATVTGITAQVLFPQVDGSAPQLETVPLSLVRTRQPYVDTQPVSAAPIGPGATADFRLIFEGIRPEWNQQKPEIRITNVQTR